MWQTIFASADSLLLALLWGLLGVGLWRAAKELPNP